MARRAARAFWIAVLLACSALAHADPVTAPPGPGVERGFDLCVAPRPPACVDQAATYARETSRAACQAAVNRYVDEVFVWRTCLESAVSRVTLDANTRADRFRCHIARRKGC
jgi:hypothetical protein